MYIADLHIHSHYSRATSKDCTPEYLDLWARHKGIGILGTGDFTHPAWREELKEKLIPAEEGLYLLKDEYRLDKEHLNGAFVPRFVISGEISSIYKKNGKVRKVHSLILLPGLEEAELLSKKLETIGNIHSDGRPILGLDCHDLLEIMLELCPRAIYVPAHIWTPHFSLFGAFSGFDTIEECFEDLTPHIRALETGLSADPPMIWRLSALDRFKLISNSDAHSPSKLGREANLLDIDLSYSGLYGAIQNGEGLKGTIEFFPEEGKYHYDGHRKCHLCLSPLEAETYSGRCPVCGRKLTTGVSHRIEQLADRSEGFVLPEGKPFESIIPLPEVIGASIGYSAASRKVQNQYESMVRNLGPEFQILRELPLEDIRKASGYLISEGIRRLREKRVECHPGFDGEYGTIQLFKPGEIDNLTGQISFFSGEQLTEPDKRERPAGKAEKKRNAFVMDEKEEQKENDLPDSLNDRQKDAVNLAYRAIAVIAGPGTGKTRTLVSRAVHLLKVRKVKASEMTAVTFTKQAAEEMRSRLEQAAGGKRAVNRMNIGTFHSICHQFLIKQGLDFRVADEMEVLELAQEVIRQFELNMKPRQFLNLISRKKTGLGLLKGEQSEAWDLPKLEAAGAAYDECLAEEGILDYDDLLIKTLRILKEEKKNEYRKQHFSYLLVDEFQDICPVQYELLKVWNRGGKELFVIGDPDQAIYSFRGADAGCFSRLSLDFKELQTIRLKENYRSAPHILSAALAVIEKNGGIKRELVPVRESGNPVRLVTAAGEMAEDIFAAKEITRIIGGIDMLDTERNPAGQKIRGFGDIAVLYRTHRQAELLEKCLRKEGIPYVVAGREDFLMQDSVRGTICFFKYLMNREDERACRLSLKLLWNLPDQDITGTVVESIIEKYQSGIKKEKPGKILLSFMEEMNFKEQEPMEKLVSMALFYKTMAEFLKALSFGGESDLKRCGGKIYTPDAVTLMTLHGSKGLEFPVVMICGVRKGRIPLETDKQDAGMEEERRLFYVGMTRAREELILITSSQPSAFLDDVPEEYMARENVKKQKAFYSGKQMSIFEFL